MVCDYQLNNDVAVVTLNRPEVLNALNGEMVEALADALDQANKDSARAGLLTGSGRGFCSGADLANLGQTMDPTNSVHIRKWVNRMHEVLLKLFEMEIPWVAAVNGPAVGVGCNFALACDLVMMSEEAYFYWAFTKRGLMVDGGGTWLLPHLVGLQRAKQMALLPEKVSASDALSLGIASSVTPQDQLMEKAADTAQRLAQGPTVAYGITKTAMNRSLSHTFREALAYEAQGQGINVRTEDVQEGIMAFLQKRDPNFKGQ